MSGYVRHLWVDNTPGNCVKMCSKAGFAFAGVQFGGECFCDHNPPHEERK